VRVGAVLEPGQALVEQGARAGRRGAFEPRFSEGGQQPALLLYGARLAPQSQRLLPQLLRARRALLASRAAEEVQDPGLPILVGGFAEELQGRGEVRARPGRVSLVEVGLAEGGV
jgi:hypothetical protein